MKRIPPTRSYFFNRLTYRCPPVTFYIEDFDRIIEAIENRGAKYKITDKEYEYDSLPELKEKRPNGLRELKIVAQFDNEHQALSIEFTRGSVKLISEETDSLVLLWRDLKHILSSRNSWYLQWLVWQKSMLLLTAILFALAWWDIPQKVPSGFGFAIIIIILLILIILMLSLYFDLRKPMLHMKPQHEVESFLARNWEKLVTGLVIAGIGSGLTKLADHLLK